MKIIADTHCYYYMSQDDGLFERVRNEPIAPTFVNVLELSKTKNLIEHEEEIRAAVQKILHFKENAIFDPPFVHAAKLFKPYDFDVEKHFGNFLEFTWQFATGVTLDKNKIKMFEDWTGEITSQYQKAADWANAEVEKIRPNIANKKEHRKKESWPLIANFVLACIKISTEGAIIVEDGNLSSLELIIGTLDGFFKELELSKMKMKANDWLDIGLLAYVQPGDKIWTHEKTWLRTIKAVGMQEYLYMPPAKDVARTSAKSASRKI